MIPTLFNSLILELDKVQKVNNEKRDPNEPIRSKKSKKRIYLFSAELNLQHSGSLVVLSVFLLLLQGFANEKNSLTRSLDDIQTMNASIIIFGIFTTLYLILCLYLIVKSIIGHNGEDYFKPKKFSGFNVLKVVLVLISCVAFIALKINDNYQLDWFSITLMVAFMFGLVGLIQALKLDRQYKENKNGADI